MIYFIGAGPGDPELMTIKGRRLIEEADVVIYAGSLVNEQVLAGRKPRAAVHNSAYMALPEVIEVMEAAEKEGKMTARVHTGDPSIYGAIKEQMDALDERGIAYEVVPGVSSFVAAAAALKAEYTLPGVTQTVILTRAAGRTPVPDGESLKELAVHRATMIIFLSVGQIENVAAALAESYGWKTPAAVVYKASWPEEKIIRGTLEDIGEKVKKEGVKKTALIVVGDFLGSDYELSRLYDPSFETGYRKASR